LFKEVELSFVKLKEREKEAMRDNDKRNNTEKKNKKQKTKNKKQKTKII
jgi:hypothetical protein